MTKVVNRAGVEVAHESFIAGAMDAGGAGDRKAKTFDTLREAVTFAHAHSHREVLWISWFSHSTDKTCRLVTVTNRAAASGAWQCDWLAENDEVCKRLAKVLKRRIVATKPRSKIEALLSFDTDSLLQWLANARVTGARAIGHYKADRNQWIADAIIAELTRRGCPVPSDASLYCVGVFNGFGSY